MKAATERESQWIKGSENLVAYQSTSGVSFGMIKK